MPYIWLACSLGFLGIVLWNLKRLPEQFPRPSAILLCLVCVCLAVQSAIYAHNAPRPELVLWVLSTGMLSSSAGLLLRPAFFRHRKIQ